MDFDAFTGEVIHRLEPPGTGESVRAIRAALMTLGERLAEGKAADLAASLPMEIGRCLRGPPREHGNRFYWQEFVSRVGEIGSVDSGSSTNHSSPPGD